jgi:hypothetical protein
MACVPGSRRAAKRLQSAHHCPPAKRRFRSLHQHTHESPVLRTIRANKGNLVLQQPLPEGRKQYTKTQPIQFEEFGECLKWWKLRKENERAWKVSAEEILSANCNLDRKNPHAKEDISHLPPEQLVESILQKEQRIMEIWKNQGPSGETDKA